MVSVMNSFVVHEHIARNIIARTSHSAASQAIPVIRFDDGSAFAMFEAFFNKTDFAALINAFEDWQKSVDNYVSSVLNKE